MTEAKSTKRAESEVFQLVLGKKDLATTYSRRVYKTTTIGKAAFDGRVRDGNGSVHSFMVTRKSKASPPGPGSGQPAFARPLGSIVKEQSRPQPSSARRIRGVFSENYTQDSRGFARAHYLFAFQSF